MCTVDLEAGDPQPVGEGVAPGAEQLLEQPGHPDPPEQTGHRGDEADDDRLDEDHEPDLAAAGPDRAEQAELAEDAELLVAGKAVSLNELVEDELLLAMPMIPMHELSECPARVSLRAQQHSRASPFAVLDKLKDKGK